MTLEEQQTRNLTNNWEIRKDLPVRIGGERGYDIFDTKDSFGRRCVYIVRNGYPIGYVAGYQNDGEFQISSTFIREGGRRLGLGFMAYKAVIQTSELVISDGDRTEGADALWSKLKRDPELNVRFHPTGVDDLGYFTAT